MVNEVAQGQAPPPEGLPPCSQTSAILPLLRAHIALATNAI